MEEEEERKPISPQNLALKKSIHNMSANDSPPRVTKNLEFDEDRPINVKNTNPYLNAEDNGPR